MSSADTHVARRSGRVLRLALVWAVVLAAGLVTAAPAQAEEVYPRPTGTTLDLRGHGWGHGNGMSQYGALGGAQAGATWRQILAHYYQGTTTTSIGNPTMRVRVASLGSTVQAYPAQGLRVTWDLSHSSVLPTTKNGVTVARWRIRPAAKVSGTPTRFQLEYLPSGSSTWRYYATASVPLTGAFLNPSSGTVTTLRSGTKVVYRGQLRGTLIGSAGSETLVPVVALPMESYLRSVVPSESPSSWPAAALSAQAVAARSFAEYHRRYAPISTTFYDVYDDTRSQVFPGTSVGGVAKEYAGSTAAVEATTGVALAYSGRIAFTQFSSSSGGWTNTGSQPYLAAVRDDWDAVPANPNHTWTTSIPITRIESAYSSIGSLTAVRITDRNGFGDMGGRVRTMTVEGTKGSVSTTGETFRSRLGLKSTWFVPTNAGPTAFPHDVTGDGAPDVLAVEADGGALRVYPTSGTGRWRAPIRQESGWDEYAKALTAGRWDADSVGDVLVQDQSGDLFLRSGNGDGTFAAPVRIGSGWQMHDLVVPAGDFDGDGHGDLIARSRDGDLYLYRGNGAGGFQRSAWRVIGSGWQIFTAIFSPGDFDGDGTSDVIARTAGGRLYLYRGDGQGSWTLPRVTIGNGWQIFTALASVGDFDGDGHADVLARDADGALLLYSGDGRGYWDLPRRQVGSGWDIFDSIIP
jgi:stage II sporulation protein D